MFPEACAHNHLLSTVVVQYKGVLQITSDYFDQSSGIVSKTTGLSEHCNLSSQRSFICFFDVYLLKFWRARACVLMAVCVHTGECVSSSVIMLNHGVWIRVLM